MCARVYVKTSAACLPRGIIFDDSPVLQIVVDIKHKHSLVAALAKTFIQV